MNKPPSLLAATHSQFSKADDNFFKDSSKNNVKPLSYKKTSDITGIFNSIPLQTRGRLSKRPLKDTPKATIKRKTRRRASQ